MPISLTYAMLKTEIVEHVQDEGAEFAARVDTIIGLGELRLLRDLNLEIFDVTDTGSFSQGNQIVNKPSGYVAGRTLYYTNAGSRSYMTQRSYEYLLDYWPAAGQTAPPKYYAELNDTQWYVAATPDSNYSYTARFMRRPAGLSGSNTTTWLSTNAADMLLYACLASSEEFLKNDGRIQVWKTEYGEKLLSGVRELRRLQRTDYAPLGAAPTPR